MDEQRHQGMVEELVEVEEGAELVDGEGLQEAELVDEPQEEAELLQLQTEIRKVSASWFVPTLDVEPFFLYHPKQFKFSVPLTTDVPFAASKSFTFGIERQDATTNSARIASTMRLKTCIQERQIFAVSSAKAELQAFLNSLNSLQNKF